MISKAPAGSGRGQAELSGRSRPMRRRSKGARPDRREDGGRGGERAEDGTIIQDRFQAPYGSGRGQRSGGGGGDWDLGGAE